MAIGNYVHARYENYLKYSLNTKNLGYEEVPNTAFIFSQHQVNMKNQLKSREQYLANKNIDYKEIEKQLNFFFQIQKGQKIDGNINEKDLKNMKKAIEIYMGSKLDKISIDSETLQSSVANGDFNAAILKAKGKYRRDLLSELQKISQNDLGKGKTTNRAYIEDRMETLLKIQDRLIKEDPENSEKLIENINALKKEWHDLKVLLKSGKKIDLTEGSKGYNFINQLNEMTSSFLTGSSTIHGEYAEAVVVAMNYLANAQATKGVSDILKQLQSGVKGQERSAKGLLAVNFDGSLVNLKEVVAGTVYDNSKSPDGFGNYFSTSITQDKVDVDLQINGFDEKIGASVKNYNLGNKSSNIHLLSGRSVLNLLQEYELFTNHYLNIVATHIDKEPGGDLLQQAHNAVKLTILLKALQGGVIARSKGENIITKKADLFIVNDNSKGQFHVYPISQILDRVENNINLLKTGDYDTLKKLSNNYIDKENGPDMDDAMRRITGLLAQLHKMSLDVSISKKALI